MRAINASVMREMNRKMLLNHIRLRPISRAELADITQLTRASVTQIIEELIDEGIVIETTVVGRTRLGRRSTQLAIEPMSGIVFGVDVRRDQCEVGAINMNGEVLAHNTELTAGLTPEQALAAAARLIEQHRKNLNLNDSRLLGVGLCVPGPVNAETGTILNPVNFEPWHHLPVADMLSELTGLPVCLESRVNALALDEHYFGSGKENYALLQIDESVSAAIMIGSKLYHGVPGMPIAPGDVVIDINNCGRTLRQNISLPALLEGTPWRSWAELIRHKTEPKAAEIIDRLVKYLTVGAVNLISSFGVPHVYLSGPLTENSDDILNRVNTAILSIFALPEPPFLPSVTFSTIRVAATPLYRTLFENP